MASWAGSVGTGQVGRAAASASWLSSCTMSPLPAHAHISPPATPPVLPVLCRLHPSTRAHNGEQGAAGGGCFLRRGGRSAEALGAETVGMSSLFTAAGSVVMGVTALQPPVGHGRCTMPCCCPPACPLGVGGSHRPGTTSPALGAWPWGEQVPRATGLAQQHCPWAQWAPHKPSAQASGAGQLPGPHGPAQCSWEQLGSSLGSASIAAAGASTCHGHHMLPGPVARRLFRAGSGQN